MSHHTKSYHVKRRRLFEVRTVVSVPFSLRRRYPKFDVDTTIIYTITAVLFVSSPCDLPFSLSFFFFTFKKDYIL